MSVFPAPWRGFLFPRNNLMFDNLKNLSGLMAQAREMKEKMEQMQAELGRRTVEADSGAGAVRVVMNGKFEVVAVHLDPHMVAALVASPSPGAPASDEDRHLIEELIGAAFNAALAKSQDMAREEMAKITGGLNLPGLGNMLGM